MIRRTAPRTLTTVAVTVDHSDRVRVRLVDTAFPTSPHPRVEVHYGDPGRPGRVAAPATTVM